MKKPILTAVVTAMAWVCLAPAPGHAQTQPTDAGYDWDLSKTLATATGTSIVDKISGNSVVFLEGSGVKIVSDPEVPGGKALAFDGSLQSNMSTQQKLFLGEDIEIKLRFKPEDGPNTADWQTVAYIFQQCELRYALKRAQVLFIVWYGEDNKTVIELSAPILPNKWNDVKASVVGSNIELIVNGTTYNTAIPDNGRRKIVENKLLIGFADKRPFTGRISGIQITPPQTK